MSRKSSSAALVPSSAVQRRLVVVGCHHSGAALVRRLLAAQQGVHDFGESGLFSGFAGGRSGYLPGVAFPFGRQRRALERVLQQAYSGSPAAPPTLPPRKFRAGRSLSGAVATLDRIALAAGCRSWVEHTATIPGGLRILERLVPDTHFIHVVRDGRDVVAAQCADAPTGRGGTSRAGAARRAAAQWNRVLAAQARLCGRTGHSFLVLEDLAVRPTAELRELSRECNLACGSGPIVPDDWQAELPEPHATRARFRLLFDWRQRRYIEHSLHLERYGRVAERARRQRSHRLPAIVPPSGASSGIDAACANAE